MEETEWFFVIFTFVTFETFVPFATLFSSMCLTIKTDELYWELILRTAISHSILFIRITYIGLVC